MEVELLELYVYTTESHERSGYVKVGHTQVGRHKTRINEQFGTSNPEPAIVRWVQPLPKGLRDHHIHDQLINNGKKRPKDAPGKEWFIATLDDVIIAYNEIVHKSSRKLNYKPRNEQLEAIAKAKKWLSKSHPLEKIRSAQFPNRFLLNAKMRFGKSYTAIHIAKELKAKRTIVVTYKPEVIGDWISDVSQHVDFENWTCVRARKKKGNPNDYCLNDDGSFPEVQGPLVLFVSLQDLKINQDGETKKRLEKVISSKWDLVIFDEVHFGSKTERAQYIIDRISGFQTTPRLDLSGTPFKIIQQDDFLEEQIFTYSYIDEFNNKKQEIHDDPNGIKEKIYRQMPDLNISTIEITQEDIDEQVESFIVDDLDFSLNELFKATKKGFKHKDAVDHFLDGLVKRDHSARSVSVYGKLGDQLGLPAVRHSVWWVHRVNSANALYAKLKKHPYFSKFEIINAAGSEKPSDDEEVEIAKEKAEIETKIAEVVQNQKKLGTITLTVSRFLTGVTIKEWESILVLNDVKSPESYYQAIFRVQSAWFDKERDLVLKPKAWVFDFAITRCLRTSFGYASALADQLDLKDLSSDSFSRDRDNLSQIMAGLCESLDIKRFYEGKLTHNETTARDIFDALNLEGSRISLAKRITSDALVDFNSLKFLIDSPQILDVLKKVKGYRSQSFGSLESLVQIGLEAGTLTKRQTDEEKEEDNEDFVKKQKDKNKKKAIKWYVTQIKRLAICMADFIYMTQFREQSIDHVIQTKDSDFFNTVTGITKQDFTELCDLGFINKSSLDRIVSEFRYQEESSLKPEEFILEHIKAMYAKVTA